MNPTHSVIQSGERLTRVACAALLILSPPAALAQLRLRLEAGGITDAPRVSNVVLHVPAGSTPSPFLPPGPFQAEWTGSLVLDLRADFRFQARHAGALSVDINDSPVLQAPHTTGATDWSGNVRLRKGTNSLRVTLSRANDSESSLRLSWQGRGVPPSPIPAAYLTSGDSLPDGPESESAAARRGRHLFLLHRCGNCHAPEVPRPVPELEADAPSFIGIGDRLRREWMSRWIADPRTLRPSATMPRLPHGPTAESDAADIATWLASLKSAEPASRPERRPVPALGRALVESLLCRACHVLEGESVDPDPEAIDLRRLHEKFPDRIRLEEYLRQPGRHFAWTRMPDFQLTSEDATHVASFLMPDEGEPIVPAPRDSPTRIGRGRVLANEHGCFNCHGDPERHGNPQPASRAPSLDALARGDRATGCLASTNDPARAAPGRIAVYGFTDGDRADFAAFLGRGASSLGRHVPSDFTDRWSAELRCGGCHGKVEGVPALTGIGEKLRAEWFEQLLRGQIAYKPRPWLASRMPAFPMFAKGLVEGYASREGLPTVESALPPADPDAAKVGRKLVSASAGFSCVTCHAVGPFGASAVFEAPGINLVHAADRLRPDFFMRWVRNPQDFDPTTRMPLYFDEEGNSALSEYYGGDGPKTLRALWEYLREGPGLVPPDP